MVSSCTHSGHSSPLSCIESLYLFLSVSSLFLSFSLAVAHRLRFSLFFWCFLTAFIPVIFVEISRSEVASDRSSELRAHQTPFADPADNSSELSAHQIPIRSFR